MRDVVRDYVAVLHATYLDQVAPLPALRRAALPLVAAREVTVVAVATRRLHLLATAQPMAMTSAMTSTRTSATTGAIAAEQPSEPVEEHLGIRWIVLFYDRSVLPALGDLVDDDPADVRRVLGVADTVYHLTVDVGGGLSGHHAQHSGVALAHQHTSELR